MNSVRTGPAGYRVFWVSDLDDPTFHVWVNGAFWGETKNTFIDLVSSGRPLRVEVLDDDEPGVPIEDALSGRWLVRWKQVDNANAYRVDVDRGDGWEEEATIQRDDNRRGYQLEVFDLPDETEIGVRVLYITPAGAEVTIRSTTALMIRVPDVPAQTFEGIGGGEIRIG